MLEGCHFVIWQAMDKTSIEVLSTGAKVSMVTQDWEGRNFCINVTNAIEKIVRFLDRFGKVFSRFW